MSKEEIKKILDLRRYLIEQYSGLDGLQQPTIATIKQSSVAHSLETAIKQIELILKDYVKFE
tara:strand:- start:55 stop:240 length:186 start_codon:yes stop_codon:yes gene_type:complete